MSVVLTSSGPFHVGGPVPLKHPTYITRAADEKLYRELKAGSLCYVLDSRQMGKTSLRVHVRRRLQEDGIRCASLDLSGLGERGVTRDQWYGGILRMLADSLGLEDALDALKESDTPSWNERFQRFFAKVLLVEIEDPVVVLLDEVDSVLKYDFETDDLFALVRSVWMMRAEDKNYERLTFGLFGTATPSDLIKDKRTTPFNVGKSVDLHGFTFEEARVLAPQLKVRGLDPEALLREVLSYSAGQPFLTQKICQRLVDRQAELPNSVEMAVADVIAHDIVENWEQQDHPTHFRIIRDRVLNDDALAPEALGTYLRVAREKHVAAEGGRAEALLILAGFVAKRGHELVVSNRVVERIFDVAWTERALKNLRPYAAALQRWLDAGKPAHEQLLEGAELEGARAWARGRALPREDHEFLWAAADAERHAEKARLLAEIEKSEQTLEDLAAARSREGAKLKRLRAWVFGASAVAGVGLLVLIVSFSAATQDQKRQYEEALAEKQEVQRQLDKLKRDTNDAVKKQADAAKVVASAEEKVKLVTEERAKAEAAFHGLRKQADEALKKAAADAQDARNKQVGAERAARDAARAANESARRLAQKEAEFKDKEAALARLEQELAANKALLETREADIRNLQDEANKLRLQLQLQSQTGVRPRPN